MRDTTTIEMPAITMADLVGIQAPSACSEIEAAIMDYLATSEDDADFVASCRADRRLATTRCDLPAIDDDSAVPRHIEPETTARVGAGYADIMFQAVA